MTLFHFNSTYKTCFFLFLIILFNILFHLLINENNTENFENKQNLILMGDSVFRNDNYVKKGQSIKDIMTKNCNNITIVAQDNAVINDLKNQYKLIPSSKNQSNSKIIISIGGNDLLNYYKVNSLSDTKYLNVIFNKYISNIEYITDNFKGQVIICNVYYPQDKPYKKFHPIINSWNKKIDEFSNTHNLKVINLDEFVNEKQHFVKGIEPSFYGGLAIKESIFNYCQ